MEKPEEGQWHVRMICGLSVKMPVEPYKCQISMLDRALKCLQRKQNCLIESPTGTGKTLALLSSCISWQQAEKERVEMESHESEQAKEINGCELSADVSSSSTRLNVDEDTENFVPQSPWRSTPKRVCVRPEPETPGVDKKFVCPVKPTPPPKERVPKIYYGTRTHQQLAQIVAELKRLPYPLLRHTILASREHSCVNKAVMSRSSKTQACHELLEHSGCLYYNKLKKKLDNPAMLRREIEAVFWDVEELVAAGREKKFCPYFAGTRVLVGDAELILCPYNYLLDPLVRQGMNIDLNGEVVVLDEAHNVEDVCRDAASFVISEEDLKFAQSFFETRAAKEQFVVPSDEELDKLEEHYKQLLTVCSRLLRWLKMQSSSAGVQHGFAISAILKSLDLDQESAKTLMMHVGGVSARSADEDRNKKDDKIKMRPPAAALEPMEKLACFLYFFFSEDGHFIQDYRMSIGMMDVVEKSWDSGDVWLSRNKKFESRVHCLVVRFWCMNPAVAFCDAMKNTSSVILASGTLCPIETFKSELGLEFPLTLEASHVLPPEHIFAAALSVSPNGQPIRCVYSKYKEDYFQDDLGQLLLEIAQVVGGGVLVFLPSYSLLYAVQKRWSSTNVLEEVGRIKRVVWEPKFGKDLLVVRREFEEAVRCPRSVSASCTGAMFFAVCRGKVSEGLDFADDFARAVVTVGIPFPNVTDPQVTLKREYNNQFQSRGLLPGDVWYEIQGFRALNQALGRCLRHKRDWGALILVDERFVFNSSYLRNVSRWIRERIQKYKHFPEFLANLKKFNSDRVAFDAETSAPPATNRYQGDSPVL